MLDNYSIKKMIPRLIIAAILVNVSFWICALAVDVSNVIGTSIYEILRVQFEGAAGTSTENNLTKWDDLTGWLLAGGGTALAIGGVWFAIGSYGVLGALSLLIPGLLAGILAFTAVIFVLIARQAFIIILIVLAPLAFVAYLLPNTEDWFNRWRKAFMTMLLLFPVVAILFGGAQLAGAIIRNGTDNILVYISSLIVEVAAIFGLFAVVQRAGGALSKVGGFVNNPNRGPIDSMRKRSEGWRNMQRDLRVGKNLEATKEIRDGSGGVLGGSKSRRRRAAAWMRGIGSVNPAEREEREKYAKDGANADRRNFIASSAVADKEYAKKLAGGREDMTTLVQSYSKQAVEEERGKDIKAEEILLRGEADLQKLFKIVGDTNESKSRRAAALNRIYTIGGDQHVEEAVDFVSQLKEAASANGRDRTPEGKAELESLSMIQQDTFEKLLKRKPAGMGNTDMSQYSEGKYRMRYTENIVDRATRGKYGAKDWATMGYDDLIRASKGLHEAHQRGDITQEQFDIIYTRIVEAQNSEYAKDNITPEKQRVLEAIKGGLAPPPPDIKTNRPPLQNMDFVDPRTIRR